MRCAARDKNREEVQDHGDVVFNHRVALSSRTCHPQLVLKLPPLRFVTAVREPTFLFGQRVLALRRSSCVQNRGQYDPVKTRCCDGNSQRWIEILKFTVGQRVGVLVRFSEVDSTAVRMLMGFM